MLSLEAVIEMVFTAASSQLIGRREVSTPMMTGFDEAGLCLVMPAPWENSTQKDLMVLTFRELLQKAKCNAYAAVSEVWIAKERRPADGSFPDISKVVPPSQRPNRCEALMIYAEDKDGQWLMRAWDIERDWKGAIAKLTEKGKGETESRSLRFSGLLQRAN